MLLSENENVLERTPRSPVALDELGDSMLQEARASNGRAAITLTPNEGDAVKQTIVALCSGQTVGPQSWNGQATLQVLEGVGAVQGLEKALRPGAWMMLTDEMTELSAQEDLILLLTVSPDRAMAADGA